MFSEDSVGQTGMYFPRARVSFCKCLFSRRPAAIPYKDQILQNRKDKRFLRLYRPNFAKAKRFQGRPITSVGKTGMSLSYSSC